MFSFRQTSNTPQKWFPYVSKKQFSQFFMQNLGPKAQFTSVLLCFDVMQSDLEGDVYGSKTEKLSFPPYVDSKISIPKKSFSIFLLCVFYVGVLPLYCISSVELTNDLTLTVTITQQDLITFRFDTEEQSDEWNQSLSTVWGHYIGGTEPPRHTPPPRPEPGTEESPKPRSVESVGPIVEPSSMDRPTPIESAMSAPVSPRKPRM